MIESENPNWCGKGDCPHCQGHEYGPPGSPDCPRIQDNIIDVVKELHTQAKERQDYAMNGGEEDAWRYVKHFTGYALNEYDRTICDVDGCDGFVPFGFDGMCLTHTRIARIMCCKLKPKD